MTNSTDFTRQLRQLESNIESLEHEAQTIRVEFFRRRVLAALANPAIRQGFAAWKANDAYHAGNGNYRLKSNGRKIAPWNKAVKHAFPTVADFASAADFIFYQLPNGIEAD